MTDIISRNVYGRVFRGAFDAIADTGPYDLIGSVFDRTNMPALVLAPGKNVYYNFALLQNTSATLALPEAYDADERLYIAVRTNLKARITFTSPTHGSGRIVLLDATDSTTEGEHAAFWSYQGDMTTFAISVPSTAQGGATTDIEVFMYEIPDLADSDNYYDGPIGYGVSGDE